MRHGSALLTRYLRFGRASPYISSRPLRWSSSSTRTWSTPLAKIIGEAIEATGPISIAYYMRQCLTSPTGGYYTTERAAHDQFGKHGDFITSPDISQIFGELVGIWVVTEWMAQGRKSSGVQLVELGPGRGTLMDDLLRTLCQFKKFGSAVDGVYLVEASHSLREVQRKLLCGDNAFEKTDSTGWMAKSKYMSNSDPIKVYWVEDTQLLPNPRDGTPTPFFVAHEFFDALPIHAFTSVPPASQPASTLLMPDGSPAARQPSSAKEPQWRELLVSVAARTLPSDKEQQTEFQLTTAKASNPASLVIPESSSRYKRLKSTPGSTIEVSPEGQKVSQDIARRIGGTKDRQPSGAGLIIDYGPLSTVPISSLRGIQNHQRVSPFASPGRVDLSADVDFTALAEAALSTSPNVEVYGPVEQGPFLQTMGIEPRAQQLLKGIQDADRRKLIESGYKRLIESAGGGMGKTYKAMAIVPESGGKRPPVGFGGTVVS
ncbi:MAG: hypothetical protein Q9227_008765 [Pyrenula ochraceoflavens]